MRMNLAIGAHAQRKYCYGKTLMEVLLASKKPAEEKMLDTMLVGSIAESGGTPTIG